MSGRRLRLAAAVPPFLLVALALVAAAEGYLRSVRFGSAGLLHPLRTMAPKFRSTDCFAPGPAGEVMSPDCRMFYKGVEIATNGFGLNDRPVDESLPHYRVAVLGDSLTMAAGVGRRRAYHARLEERLGEELGAPGFVELYNLGRGGRSTGEELRDLRWLRNRVPVDAVVVGVVYNDLFDNLLKRQTCGPGDEALQLDADERRVYRERVEGLSKPAAMFGLFEQWTGLWVWNRLYDQLRTASRRVRGDRGVAETLAAMERKAVPLFRSCARAIVAEASGLPRLWLGLWYRPDPHVDLMRRELEALGERFVAMDDLHREFDGPAELFIYPGDHHPGDAVHGAYAERVHRAFAELGWLRRIEQARAAR